MTPPARFHSTLPAFVTRAVIGTFGLGLGFLVALPPAAATEYYFGTLTGQPGVYGSADGSGQTGDVARFRNPYDVAVDGSGNVYVADTGNHTVRKITPAGITTTFAGLAGAAGNVDGLGSAARFNAPTGLVVDGGGNLYVSSDNTIRKITPEGWVTTLAGASGIPGFAEGSGSAARFNSPVGLAMDGSGNLYVADSGNARIRKVTPAGLVSTLVSSPPAGVGLAFKQLMGVALDGAGNLYASDGFAQVIWKITPAGAISILAGAYEVADQADGTGADARFNGPRDLVIDAAGNLYVGEYFNQTVRKITPDGTVTTMPGVYYFPYGLDVDGAGTVYVADYFTHTIKTISATGATSTLMGQNGLAGSSDGVGNSALFAGPDGLAVDQDRNIYVADALNHTIRKVSPSGSVTTFAGLAGVTGDADGTGTAAKFNAPAGVVVDADGYLFVADSNNHTIRKVSPGGQVTTVAGLAGSPGSTDGAGSDARFNHPTDLAMDAAGNLYVADTSNHTIRKVSSEGAVITLAGSAEVIGGNDGTGSEARFFSPAGVAVEGNGTVYVADSGNGTVRKVTPSGTVSTLAGLASQYGSADGVGSSARFGHPSDVALDAAGNLYVTDPTQHTIRMITQDGTVTTIGGLAGESSSMPGAGNAARFIAPNNIAVDATGAILISSNLTIRKGVPHHAAEITTSPATQAVRVGTALTLSPAPTGSPVTGIQWQKNGADHPGADAAALTLFDAQPADSGLYTAAVTRADGSVTNYAVTVVALRPSSNFNLDLHADILWRNSSTGETKVSLMNGTVPDSEISLGTIGTTWSVVTGDFNADAQADLLWQNTADGDCYIWLMNGTAIGSSTFLGSPGPQWLAAGTGDFNADGHADILWSNPSTGDHYVWLMHSTSLISSVFLWNFSSPWSIAGTGDFNADGHTDIVWQNTATGERLVSHMTRTSRTGQGSIGVVSTTMRIVQVGDFNIDGKPDLLWQNLVTGERVIWLMNGLDATSTVSLGAISTLWVIGPNTVPAPAGQTSSDFNGDGKSDLVWSNASNGDRYLWLMNDTAVATSHFLGTVDPIWLVATGDFNGDGKAELLWSNSANGDRYIWVLNATAVTSSYFLGTVAPIWSVTTGDFDGDGKSDLLWSNTSNGDRYVWLMNGTAVTSSIFLSTVAPVWSAATGDFNADGKADLLWSNTSNGDRYVWLMNGTAVSSSVFLSTVAPVWSVSTGDYNSDGKTDLLWSSTSSGDRYVWLMNGTAVSSSVFLSTVAPEWAVAP